MSVALPPPASRLLSCLPARRMKHFFLCTCVSECVTVPGSDRSTQLHHCRAPPPPRAFSQQTGAARLAFYLFILFCFVVSVLPVKELQGHSSPVSSILSITYSHLCQNVRHACAAMRSLRLRRVFPPRARSSCVDSPES